MKIERHLGLHTKITPPKFLEIGTRDVCLFKHIQKEKNMLKSSLKTARVNNSRILRFQNAYFQGIVSI